MAKKIVKVNEEEIRGYMVGDIPDAVEKEDVIVVEVPAEETDKRNLVQSVKMLAVSVRSIW